MQIDMKVVDKWLQGKGHKDPFIKLAADDGSQMKLMLESRSMLSNFVLEEWFTVELSQNQQTLEPEDDDPENLNVISWSGGHDSTAMLHHLIHRKGFDNFKVVFLDSTITLPETLEYIDLIVKEFGIQKQFVSLKPKLGFYGYLMKYSFWPAIRALWCRKELKLMRDFIKGIECPVTEFVGVSQFDSSIRKSLYRKIETRRKWGRKEVTVEYPILRWSDQQKKQYFKKHRIPRNRVYETMGVSGCYFCPYYHEKEFRKLYRFHPDLFELLVCCEEKIGKRAVPDFWLKSLIQENKITNYMEEKQ